MKLEHSAEVAEERQGEARTSSALFLEMGFSPSIASRRLKWSWVIALTFHLLLFAVVLPSPGSVNFDIDNDEVLVIRRYDPPEIEQREKPRRRKKAPAVPIPDPTPDAFEPIVPDDELLELERDEDIDEVYEFGMPSTVGPPAQGVAIETEGLVLPILLEQAEPDYDPSLARRGVQGAADVEIVISTDGFVSMARIINSTTDETLDQAALDAVSQWVFEPGLLNGERVPVRAIVTINFRVY